MLRRIAVVILIFFSIDSYTQRTTHGDSLQFLLCKKLNVQKIISTYYSDSDTVITTASLDSLFNLISQRKSSVLYFMGHKRKKTEAITWVYDENGHKVSKKIIENDTLDTFIEWKYDRNGNETEKHITRYNRSEVRDTIDKNGEAGVLFLELLTQKESTFRKYDINNRLIRSEYYFNGEWQETDSISYDSTGKEKFFWMNYRSKKYSLSRWLKYNENGQLIKSVVRPKLTDNPEFGGSQVTDIVYDSLGNKIEYTWYSAMYGKVISHQKYTYNESGQMVKEVDDVTGQKEFKYDKSGNKESEWENGKKVREFFYRKNGLLKEEIKYKFDSTEKKATDYKYIFEYEFRE